MFCMVSEAGCGDTPLMADCVRCTSRYLTVKPSHGKNKKSEASVDDIVFFTANIAFHLTVIINSVISKAYILRTFGRISCVLIY